MAKVVQDNIVISVSKVARDDAPEDGFVSAEAKASIEQICAEVLGDGFVIEVLS